MKLKSSSWNQMNIDNLKIKDLSFLKNLINVWEIDTTNLNMKLLVPLWNKKESLLFKDLLEQARLKLCLAPSVFSCSPLLPDKLKRSYLYFRDGELLNKIWKQILKKEILGSKMGTPIGEMNLSF